MVITISTTEDFHFEGKIFMEREFFLAYWWEKGKFSGIVHGCEFDNCAASWDGNIGEIVSLLVVNRGRKGE